MSSDFPEVAIGCLDEASLLGFAGCLAGCMTTPLVIYLEGDLGAGKTTFCRALIQALGYPGRVKSPTYGLLERYELPQMNVLHLDLYRIGDPGELEYLAIPDLFDDTTLLLVEWPERGEGALPAADLVIRLEHAHDARFVYLNPRNTKGEAISSELTKHASS